MASVRVMRYADGERVGRVELPDAEWERYAACEHPAYQWPGGLAEAGDVLGDDALGEMGLTAETVIYLEE